MPRKPDSEAAFSQRLEAEKLAALAEFAAGAGHEMNNPLAVISGRAQLLLRGETDPERRRDLAIIHAQALRVHEMIADLMLFARPPQPHKTWVDAVALAEETVQALVPAAAARGVELVRSGAAGPAPLWADGVQLRVALQALCENALYVSRPGDRVEVAVLVEAPAAAGSIAWSVRDSGPGIGPEERRHLFDPFYSGRPAGRGLGMGLAKCWRIAAMHDGQIEAASTPGAGATFTITLPATAPPALDGAGQSRPPE